MLHRLESSGGRGLCVTPRRIARKDAATGLDHQTAAEPKVAEHLDGLAQIRERTFEASVLDLGETWIRRAIVESNELHGVEA